MMKKPIDYSSIKSLREHGILVSGNSASRINPEENVRLNGKRIDAVLKKAMKLAEERKARLKMSPEQRLEIVKAYHHLERLLRKHLPFKRMESIRANAHLKLNESRFSFELAWDEDEDAHLETKE